MGVLPIRYLRDSAICCGEFSKTAASTLASWLETAKYLILITTTSTVTIMILPIIAVITIATSIIIVTTSMIVFPLLLR